MVQNQLVAQPAGNRPAGGCRQRLRIEHGDGEGVVAKVLPGRRLHFLGSDGADLVEYPVDAAPADAVHFGAADFHLLAHHFSRLPEHFRLVIVDSITLLVAHSNPVAIIDFFSRCKGLCDDGRTIILVAHSYAFEEDMLARTRSLCDARFRLRLEQVGDSMIKLMEVLKVRGAERPTGDVVSFNIEPKLGMRIIPLAKARV